MSEHMSEDRPRRRIGRALMGRSMSVRRVAADVWLGYETQPQRHRCYRGHRSRMDPLNGLGPIECMAAIHCCTATERSIECQNQSVRAAAKTLDRPSAGPKPAPQRCGRVCPARISEHRFQSAKSPHAHVPRPVRLAPPVYRHVYRHLDRHMSRHLSQ